MTTAARPDADRRVWRAEFVASADTDWSIELTSGRGVPGVGPAGMRISVEP